jgi:hypothetical protein
MSIIVYKNVQQIEGIEVGPPGKQLKCDRQDDGRPTPSSLEANMPPWHPGDC